MITKKKLFGYFLFILVVVILPPALDRGASYYIKRTKYAPLIFTKYDPKDTARKVHERYYQESPNEGVTVFNTEDYGGMTYDVRQFFTSSRRLKDNRETNQQELSGYFDYYGVKTLLGFYDRCYLTIYFDNYIFSTSKSWCSQRNLFNSGIKEDQHVF